MNATYCMYTKNYRDGKEVINTPLNIVIYCNFGYWAKFKQAQQFISIWANSGQHLHQHLELVTKDVPIITPHVSRPAMGSLTWGPRANCPSPPLWGCVRWP